MKKIIAIFLVCFMLILGGCSLDSTTRRDANIIDEYNVYEVQTALTAVASKVESACIGILNRATDGNDGTGSGVIFKKEEASSGYTYYAITNYHVVDGYKYLKAYLGRNNKGDIYVYANYIGGSEKEDIAVISFSTTKELGVVEFGLDDNLLKGQFVVAIGCPLGLSLFNTVTTGVISNYSDSEIQHDSAINPGNSGGGLFNLEGRLIGINSSKYSTVGGVGIEGIGFAINIILVNDIVNQIMSGNIKPTPLLGISVMEYQKFLNYSTEEEIANVISTLDGGIVVVEVSPQSNADLGGIKQYDVITSFNGKEVYTQDDMKKGLSEVNLGDTVKVVVNRKGTVVELDVTLN